MANDKTQTDKEMVQIPRQELEELREQRDEDRGVIAELIEKMNRLENAALTGQGVDPIITARANLPTKLVQFNEHYHRAAKPSQIKGAGNTHEGYAVARGEVVKLRRDEYDRLKDERPGIFEDDQSKFRQGARRVAKPAVRRINGRDVTVNEVTHEPIEVKELIKNAPVVG